MIPVHAYPFESQDTSESEYSRLFAELQDSGIADSADGPAFSVWADSSGMHVYVEPGVAILRGHVAVSDERKTLPIAPAASAARVDVVVLRLNPETDSIVLAVKTGTAGSSVPAPLERTESDVYEIALATVAVAGSAVNIAAEAVTDLRVPVSGRVGVWTTDTRPEGARLARLGYNRETGVWEYWDNGWQPLQPTVSWGSVTGKPSTFTPSNHTHSWSEITDKPSTYAPAPHSHSWAQITDKPSSFTPSSHSHTVSQITNLPPIAPGASAQANAIPRYDANGRLASYGPTAGGHVATKAYVDALMDKVPAVGGPYGAPPNVYMTSGGAIGRTTAGAEAETVTSTAYGRQAGSNRYAMWMDGDRRIGRATSSRRYKSDEAPWQVDVDAVLAIVPKTFHRNVDDAGVMDFGAIAEDLHDLGLTDLVYYDEQGRPDGIQDHRVTWALLAVIRRQEERIDGLHEVVEALSARLDDVEARADS